MVRGTGKDITLRDAEIGDMFIRAGDPDATYLVLSRPNGTPKVAVMRVNGSSKTIQMDGNLDESVELWGRLDSVIRKIDRTSLM